MISASGQRRILMTTDAVGGVWTYATSLARGLCEAGYEVTLVVMGPSPGEHQLRPLRDMPRLRVEVTDLALEWMDAAGADVPRARDTLLRIAERVRPDIIHLNSFREACFDWPAPVVVAAHSCVWSWWSACRGGSPDEAPWQSYRDAVAAGLAAADAWVAPTAAFRDTIAALYQPPTTGRVIWNGSSVAHAEAAREPFVLAAGRLWDPAKNLVTLEAVAAELDWPVRVAGPTSEPGTVTTTPLSNQVTHLGELPRHALLDQMQRAGVFVAPALYEPFGLTVLEAASAGCGLVLADIESFRELWDGAALFALPRDAEALRDAIQAVIRDDDLRDRLQRAARMRAERYSMRATVSGYRALYDTMTSGSTLASGSAVTQRVRSAPGPELHPA